MVAELGSNSFTLTEAHRFANNTVSDAGLRWDFEAIWNQILAGLAKAAQTGPLDAIGIDSWAVDYGLVNASGELIDQPFCYRDARTVGVPEQVWERIGRRRLYEITGVQHQRFNTVFQLWDDLRAGRLSQAASILLIPDLIAFRLTGKMVSEVTNASTTGLFDGRSREWSVEIIDRLGFPRQMLPDVVEAGAVLGPLHPRLRTATGIGEDCQVVAVGTHDTASAVAAVPAEDPAFGYVSCGTWSLVGAELTHPICSAASLEKNFTNEAGVFGTVRYLKNVMGLWLLTECQRSWHAENDLAALLAEAAMLPPTATLIDADDDEFLPPGAMPERIAAAIVRSGGEPPESRSATVRCIIDSLAASYARALRQAAELTGRDAGTVHVVGGGSLNRSLCQATADQTGLPVMAGPVEASAIGNALVQAAAIGAIPRELGALRTLVRSSFTTTEYLPANSQPKGS